MSDFTAFFQMGLDHIMDIHAYDHLLFISSLLIVYRVKEIKEVLIVLTAFTCGHAFSMILALFGITPLSGSIVEFLIPLTIVTMTLYHIFLGKGKRGFVYAIVIIFGLIHGLAYAKDLLLMISGSMNTVVPLLGFNLGVEAAQVAFGLLGLLFIEGLTRFTKAEHSAIRMFTFGVIFILSLQLLIENRIW